MYIFVCAYACNIYETLEWKLIFQKNGAISKINVAIEFTLTIEWILKVVRTINKETTKNRKLVKIAFESANSGTWQIQPQGSDFTISNFTVNNTQNV